ncbi:MAG: hypothetical protein JHD02_00885 [Thermoleophilaceae bacterium]|nr:hypothetical protein [Thermoleophilaceae bacterium]
MAAARQLRVRNDLRTGAAKGADLASAAGNPGPGNGGAEQLRAELAGESPAVASGRGSSFMDLLQNRYMMLNILYAALLFGPSGIYLVWGYPEWETMQAGNRDMPAWLIVSFAITNVTQAILAFWVVERLVVSGRQYLGMLQAWFGYFGLFFILVNGWDTFGWHRFFSEDRADFLQWNSEPAIDQAISWVTSPVALTLWAMGLILIPVLAWILFSAVSSGYRIGGAYTPSRKPIHWMILVPAVAIGIFSGVPVAIICHLMINELGWILGALASTAFIYLVMLRPGTGLLNIGYKYLALEDSAYQRILDARGGRPGPDTSIKATPSEVTS